MIREDFLMRVIRQIVLMIAASRKQRDEARFEDALASVDGAARSLLGLDTQLLATMPHRSLREILSPSGRLDAARATGVGMLLQERGAILDLLDRPDEARQARLQSLALWLEILELPPGPENPVVVDDDLLSDLLALAAESPLDQLSSRHQQRLLDLTGRLEAS